MITNLDLDLRCHRCQYLAYHEEYQGELGPEGYTCTTCIKVLNEKALKTHRELMGFLDD